MKGRLGWIVIDALHYSISGFAAIGVAALLWGLFDAPKVAALAIGVVLIVVLNTACNWAVIAYMDDRQ